MRCHPDRLIRVCGAIALAGLGAWLAASPVMAVPADGARGALSAEQHEFLAGLLGKPLFDPAGAQRVRVPVVVRTVWAASVEVPQDGWLVPGKDGAPARVHFTDGWSIPAPEPGKIERIDLVAACRARYQPKKPKPGEEEGRRAAFRRMRQTAVGVADESDLTLAVWLDRLGQKELAFKALLHAEQQAEGDRKKAVAALRGHLAWSAFADMVHAYMVRADEEALASARHLVRLYPEEAKKEYPQAEAVLDSLAQRKTKGTFGKEPAKEWPEGFEKWEAKRKIGYLIEALDEVDARQWGQPGGVPLATDRRVQELIKLGHAATPEDVAAGRAVFHLDGKGKRAAIVLPATAALRTDGKEEHPPRVLIVQAETDADGNVVCGVITPSGLRTVKRSELDKLVVLAEPTQKDKK